MQMDRNSLIIPKQLQIAREALALSVREVASKLSIAAEVLSDWENGRSEPSIEQLWELAYIYQRNTDYFLRETSPFPSGLSFRLVQRNAVADLSLETRKILVRFDELCRAEKELEIALGKPRRIFIDRVANYLDPRELADRERKRLGLDNEPIKDLRGLLTKLGIRTFELPIPVDKASGLAELSGLAWWHEDYGPCIFVNSRDEKGRRCFTMAHEYVHLLRTSEPPSVCDLEKDIDEERFANIFAANFLMPASDLRLRFSNSVGPAGTMPTNKQLGTLKDRYGVSLEAMGRRLEDLRLVPEGFANSRIDEWKEKGKHFRRPKSPSWRRQLGDHFVDLAIQSYSTEHISLGKLAHYLGQDIRKAHEIVKGLGAPNESRSDS